MDDHFAMMQTMMMEQMKNIMTKFCSYMLQSVLAVPSAPGAGVPPASSAPPGAGVPLTSGTDAHPVVRLPPGFNAFASSSAVPTAGVAGFTGRFQTSTVPMITAGFYGSAPPVPGAAGSTLPPALAGLPASASAGAGLSSAVAGLTVPPGFTLVQLPAVLLQSSADQRAVPGTSHRSDGAATGRGCSPTRRLHRRHRVHYAPPSDDSDFADYRRRSSPGDNRWRARLQKLLRASGVSSPRGRGKAIRLGQRSSGLS